jgi:hypothetical protein
VHSIHRKEESIAGVSLSRMLMLTAIDKEALQYATNDWQDPWEMLPATKFRAHEYRCSRLVQAGFLEQRVVDGSFKFRKIQPKG